MLQNFDRNEYIALHQKDTPEYRYYKENNEVCIADFRELIPELLNVKHTKKK